MPSAVMNENKQVHEDFVRSLLSQHLNLKVLDITPLTGGQNGIVYRLAVAREPSLRERDSTPAQPATTPLPADTTTLVIRLSDPAAMLNETVRVQNEVALMSFIREALAAITPSIVPAVYAWGKSVPGDGSQEYVPGWVVLEHMPGVPLAPAWRSLDDVAQKQIMQQMATVLHHIQSYKLPDSIKQYGGLNFDDEGRIIVGATPIDGTLVPCNTHAELYMEYMKTMLKSADKCDVMKGWHDTNLRSRLDAFASKGLRPMLEKAAKQDSIRPTLVHGDFDIHNLLFDPFTNRLTALLDYDFGHIASPADEYFYSFASIFGIVVGSYDACSPPMVALRACMLDGFPADAASRPSEVVDWKTAVAWDAAQTAAGAKKPGQIEGMAVFSSVYWFIQNISPQELFIEKVRKRLDEEALKKRRGRQQRELESYLDAWGY